MAALAANAISEKKFLISKGAKTMMRSSMPKSFDGFTSE